MSNFVITAQSKAAVEAHSMRWRLETTLGPVAVLLQPWRCLNFGQEDDRILYIRQKEGKIFNW
jgi:hypothetical protein